MDLSRAKYILPNLFTLASVFAGLYSINLTTRATSVEDLRLAALLIIVAMFCDAFDGRVARMTGSESAFGVQLDSLADAISFGVAPGILLYQWGMLDWGMGGMAVAFVYTACAIMRLARFNVMAQASDGVKKYFLGLPTPLAAGTVVSVVLAHLSVTAQMATGATLSVVVMTLLLSGLMVSNVRYRTFKDVNFRGRAGLVLLGVLAASGAMSLVFEPSVTLVALMAAYIFLGLSGGIIHLGRHVISATDADPHAPEELDEMDVREEEG